MSARRPRAARGPSIVLAWSLAACSPTSPASRGEETLVERLGPQGEPSSPASPPEGRAAPTREFAVRADGARLVGTLLPARVSTDDDAAYRLDARPGARPLPEGLDGALVLDATFVEDVAVTIGADHALRVHREDGVDTLDTDARAPFSIVGDRVAYARGEPPSLEVAVAALRVGRARVWSHALAPLWNPALAPDGRSVVAVSGAAGVPRMVRVREDGAVAWLVDEGAFPASPTAPRFDGMRLTFEDERGHAHQLAIREARP